MRDFEQPQEKRGTSIVVELDDKTLADYKEQAKAVEQSLESFLARRLKRCRGFSAERPIYFNDKQRNRLESLLGGHRIDSSEQAITRLAQALAITLAGVNIQLNSDVLARLKSRLRRDKPFPVTFEPKVKELINKFIRGEVSSERLKFSSHSSYIFSRETALFCQSTKDLVSG